MPALLLCLVAALEAPPAAAQAGAARVRVDARRVEGRLSPLLYGHFMEFMYEGVKGGLYAELIRNRSFEEPPNAAGLSRYWERYPDDRNDDYGLAFAWDAANPYPPARKKAVELKEKAAEEHSLRVEAGDGVISRHGFYQPRVPVRAGQEYRGYLWMKTAGYEGRVTVSLESDATEEVYGEADISGVAGDWRKYEFRLKPAKTDRLAKFAILFYGRGRVLVDQVSLMPADAAAGGVRRDVFEQVKALRPAFLRWPGGNVAQDYRWPWGVGPRDERVTWANLSWKNEPEPSDFGTDEYVEFARAVGAEPTITVNVEGRGADAEEAAAWVEYCNGPATSKFGAMRARGGHPEPYNIKLWEVGNEIWGPWVRGHSAADVYARNYTRYVRAMRAVDPSIKFIAVGDNDMNWNRTVLQAAGPQIDYLAIHHYYSRHDLGGDDLNLMARPLRYERFYQQVEALINELVPHKAIKLAINEWGLDLPVERQYSMDSAVYGARLMNVFERRGDLVEMSAVSDLVNGWPGGIIQANRHSVFVSPLYRVIKLYNERRGDERLATSVEGRTYDTTREGKNVPVLDAVASRSADGRKIFIKLVNTDRQRALETTIEVAGARAAGAALLETITTHTPATANSFQTPNAIDVRGRQLSAGPGGFTVLLPKQSVSVVTLNVR
ncbi:MAG TPA: alpha-L-arabinofuranosidase C-terminal domain-containing protein [Pyrinomonadaceae bacterium]